MIDLTSFFLPPVGAAGEMLTLGDSGGALASLGERLTLTGPFAAAVRRGRRGGWGLYMCCRAMMRRRKRGARAVGVMSDCDCARASSVAPRQKDA